MIRLVLPLLLAGLPAAADTLIATHTIPARSVIEASDLDRAADATPGAIDNLDDAIGLEARVTIYAGRPVRAGDLGPPALVDRNQIVALVYDRGGIAIGTDGRALDRGALGERLRVMNLSSKTTVIGTVSGPGRISVP